jgi:hypothetical protein
MTTGSSWNGRWQASGPARDRLRPSSAACWSHVPSTQTLHATAAARAPIGVFPCSPALPVSWAGEPHPIRARVRYLGARFRWSGTYMATDSGAVSAGSNPAGGTGQRHKSDPATRHPALLQLASAPEPRTEQLIVVLLRARRGVRLGGGTATGAPSGPSDGPRIPSNGSHPRGQRPRPPLLPRAADER